MKIAVSTQGNSSESIIDSRFGRCANFAVFDTEKDNWSFIENDGAKAGGGAGLAAAQQIIDNGIQVLITGNMGPNAFDVLNSEEISVFKYENGSVQDAVNGYKEKKLYEITAAGPAHAGQRGDAV